MAGNWKMHKTFGEAIKLVEALLEGVGDVEGREVLVCPPFTALYPVGRMLRDKPIEVGAQNMYPAEEGAYTGEVSPKMLLDCWCQYVILGHSERRQYFDESDAFINRKVQVALAHGLRPILCVGETEAQRLAGRQVDVVTGQLEGGLQGITAERMSQVVIAYEPIWAIGTGRTARPEDAQEMQAQVRALLAAMYGAGVAEGVRILYGGSVKPGNVDALMAQPDIDGALVGGASLDAESFIRIVRYRA